MVLSIAFVFLFLISFISVSLGGFFGNNKAKASQKENNEKNRRRLLPVPPPHKDSCYLLEFHTDNSDVSNQMEPVVRRLEDDLQTTVRRINIFTRKDTMSLLDSIGFDECGKYVCV